MLLDISCSPCKSYKHISFLQFLLLVILYHLFTKNSIPYIKQRRIRLFYHKHILWSRNLKWTKQVRFFIFIQAELRLGMESMRLRIVWNCNLTPMAFSCGSGKFKNIKRLEFSSRFVFLMFYAFSNISARRRAAFLRLTISRIASSSILAVVRICASASRVKIPL